MTACHVIKIQVYNVVENTKYLATTINGQNALLTTSLARGDAGQEYENETV